METKKFLLILSIIGTTFVSCSNNDDVTEVTGEPTSMRIVLKNGIVGTRATAATTQEAENTVSSFTVYVFNSASGTIEKMETFTPSNQESFSQEIENLTTGAKKVVVLANVPTGYTLDPASSYSELETQVFDLETQVSTKLAMSGESSITLAANPTANTLPVNLNRVVSKIKLQGITVLPADGQDGSFELKKVHIMKARGKANFGVPTLQTSSDLYGGIPDPAVADVSSVGKNYLTEGLAGDTYGQYFYVFPNNNTDNNATLLTIEATYNGIQTFFPFRINDNEFIGRNEEHTISVTINHPGNGTTDPETLVDPATLTVSITVQDWTPKAGNVTW